MAYNINQINSSMNYANQAAGYYGGNTNVSNSATGSSYADAFSGITQGSGVNPWAGAIGGGQMGDIIEGMPTAQGYSVDQTGMPSLSTSTFSDQETALEGMRQERPSGGQQAGMLLADVGSGVAAGTAGGPVGMVVGGTVGLMKGLGKAMFGNKKIKDANRKISRELRLLGKEKEVALEGFNTQAESYYASQEAKRYNQALQQQRAQQAFNTFGIPSQGFSFV